MQMREKLLASGLAAVVGIFSVPKVWSWFIDPVAVAEANRNSAQKQHDDRSFQKLQVGAKKTRLQQWQGRSLSPKPTEAASQYQQWLTDMAEVVAEFSNVSVVPDPPRRSANQPFEAIGVTLKAEATLAQVRLFLFRFFQADVMQSITQLSLDSPSATGNPKLAVLMKFEALSLRDAPPRGPSLFARTEVAEDWNDPTQSLTVRHAEDFPTKTPFLVRVGKHFFQVSEATGNSWTLKPDENSVQATAKQSVALLTEEIVELVPIHPEFSKRSISDFDPILKRNPFVKPVPYAPKLEIDGAKSVSRGGSLDLTCRATGFDLSAGEPLFTLEGDNIPNGLSLDGRTGKLTWKPDDEQPLGDFKLQVTVKAEGLKPNEPLTQALTVSLKQTNKPPKFESVSQRSAVLGREFVFAIKASDDDPETKLTFSLGTGAPEGAKIDAATGELKWTPPATLVPGPVKLTVQVADNGNPPNTVKQDLTINVGDDLAQFTKLTGILEVGGKKELRLSDLANNRSIVLHEGDQLRYADIEATVVRIDRKAILLKKDDVLWRLDLGETLSQLRKLEPAAAPEAPVKRD
ncbi:MAG: putative Ig domain-containing protein [Planctomycetaceae bacterium]